MELPLYDQNGESLGQVTVSDRIFGMSMNKDLLYQVVSSQIANRRQIIAHAKGRGEVRGGGKKPWRQKGTGRARHGSIRSPIWKGGGVTHGPTKKRNFKKKINKKAARRALQVALSSKVGQNCLAVVSAISMPEAKTKAMAGMFKKFTSIMPGLYPSMRGKKPASVMVVVPSSQNAQNIQRSARNIKNASIRQAADLNALDIMSVKYMLVLKDSLPVIEKVVK